MNHYEKMVENYEDAVFFLLMDRLAEEQGEKYKKLNDELKKDSEYAVPEEVSAACYKSITREFARIRRKNTRRTAGKIFQRVCVAIVVLLLTMISALAISRPLRVQTLNWVIEIMDDHINLHFISNTNSETSLQFQWLPEEFEYTYASDGMWMFEDNAEHWIIITAVENDGSEMNVDIENATLVEEISIRDGVGLYIEKESSVLLAWNDMSTGQAISVCADSLDRTEIVKIAENIFLQ